MLFDMRFGDRRKIGIWEVHEEGARVDRESDA